MTVGFRQLLCLECFKLESPIEPRLLSNGLKSRIFVSVPSVFFLLYEYTQSTPSFTTNVKQYFSWLRRFNIKHDSPNRFPTSAVVFYPSASNDSVSNRGIYHNLYTQINVSKRVCQTVLSLLVFPFSVFHRALASLGQSSVNLCLCGDIFSLGLSSFIPFSRLFASLSFTPFCAFLHLFASKRWALTQLSMGRSYNNLKSVNRFPCSFFDIRHSCFAFKLRPVSVVP